MGRTVLITDTDSSLPVDIAKQRQIVQVPITIHFGEQSYTTGVDIDDTKVFELVDQMNRLPTTAAPSPGAFAEAYRQAFADGADEVICLTVSSKISATYSSAVTACEMFAGKKITVIDTFNLCMGQGLLVLAAADAIKAGKSAAEIQEMVTDMNTRLPLYGLLPSLKYLAMSGRVGKLAAGMADTLSIKPILTNNAGKLELLEKIRTQKKAIARLLELAKEAAGERKIERAAMFHVNNPAGAAELESELRAILPLPKEVIHAGFTPGLSVHAGAGVVGFTFLLEK
jgi:DegV family protein with EDD domain